MFKTKNKSKNKKALDIKEGKSKALDKKILKDVDLDVSDLDEVTHATNAMNIVLSGAKSFKKGKSNSLENSRNLITKNYDLASRKIIATYRNVLATGSYISTKFIAVQMSLYLYERKINPSDIIKDLNIFINETWKKVAKGISVKYGDEVVFEPVQYVDKILPAVTISPSSVRMLNAVTWDELLGELIKNNLLTNTDREIYETFMKIVIENVEQGYYIQLNDVILIKIRIGSKDNILLFSEKTLKWFNTEYRKSRNKIKRDVYVKQDSINQFSRTMKSVEQKYAIEKQKDESVEMTNELSDDERNLKRQEIKIEEKQREIKVKSTEKDIKATEKNIKSTEKDIKATEKNIKSTEKDIKATEKNIKVVEKDIKLAEKDIKTTKKSTMAKKSRKKPTKKK